MALVEEYSIAEDFGLRTGLGDDEASEQFPATQRLHSEVANQFRVVIVFADMSQEQCGNCSVQTLANKSGGDFIRQMSAASHDALLDRPGVRTDAQHFEIMIGLQDKHVGAAKMDMHGIRNVAEIGGESNFDAVGRYGVADRIRSIVRNGEALDIKIADAESRAGLEVFDGRRTFSPLDV